VSLPEAPTGEGPPLPAGTALLEQRFPGRISSRERVLVGVDAAGRPRSVTVTQRLVFAGTGDYVVAVGAPAIDVEAAPGSRSEPGLRADAILWQGFSPGRRELAATARLRLADSAFALPLRLTLDGGELVVENVTGSPVETFDGRAAPKDVERALRELRRAAATDARRASVDLGVSATRPRTVLAEAPIEIAGQLNGRRFAAILGGGRPRRLVVHAPRSSPPRLTLTARPVLPPGALDGPPTVATAVASSLRLSRVREYDAFLANPDRFGSSRTVYEYRFEPARAAGAQPADSGSEGWSALQIFVAAGSALLGLGAAAALWARF
jgi:hypothetical protein